MPATQNRAETSDTSGERQSLVQRLLALPVRMFATVRRNTLLAVVLLSGTMVIVGSATSVAYYLVTHSPSSNRNVTIEAALALLDAGKYGEAKQMSLRLRKKIQGDYRQLGHPLFVEGVALAQEAASLGHEEKRQTLNLVAARYLEEAQDRGFPPGREQQGLYLLATSLFHAGHFAESLPALRKALEKLPSQKYVLAHFLSTAYLRDTTPNLKHALHFNRIWLENPALPKPEREEALLQLAEILLESRDTTTCHEVLSKIDEDARVHDQALVIQARLSIQEGDQLTAESGGSDAKAKAKYRQAIGTLERAQSKDLLGVTTRRSRYLLGICYQKLGDPRAAAAAFERTRRTHYGTPEALAATLAEGEIAQQQGRNEIALTMYLKVLEEAGLAPLYQNPWVSLSDLRGRLIAGQQQFILAGEFESALTMADAFDPIVPADDIAATKAESHEAWAVHLLEKANESEHASAELTRAEARRQFRLAADHYRTLAKLRFTTSEYPTDLWKSGYCFLRGQNHEVAIRMLRQHLDNVPRKQSPQGLVSLGECELALGHYHTAISVLDECIKYFPKHPESYRARILASRAYRETGKLAEAETLLIDNLHNSSLTPRSRYWQESLLNYGKLLFTEAMILESDSRKLTTNNPAHDQRQAGLKELQEAHNLFQKAVNSLEEAVARRPNGKRSSEARYYIAEAYRHSANLPKRFLEIEPTQTRRNTLRQQIRAHLQEAARVHRELQDELARKQNETDLPAVEKSILRNTYFAYADVLFALKEYEQAIPAYAAATNRYQHEPEALEALLQIASCYRRLDSPDETRGTLLQAESVLSRIRQDADFRKTTRCNRSQWEQLIGWLSQL